MNVRYLSFSLPFFLISFSFLNGCATSWNGGIPPGYKHIEKFPVIAAVSGISEYLPSQEGNAIVENYVPTNQITLNTNTIHGWVVQFQPVDRELVAEEYYVLPKAARWNCDTNSQIVSRDQTTCRTVLTVPKNSSFVSHDWGMFLDDPVGEYEIAVFVDHKFAVDFKFRVLDSNASSNK